MTRPTRSCSKRSMHSPSRETNVVMHPPHTGAVLSVIGIIFAVGCTGSLDDVPGSNAGASGHMPGHGGSTGTGTATGTGTGIGTGTGGAGTGTGTSTGTGTGTGGSAAGASGTTGGGPSG